MPFNSTDSLNSTNMNNMLRGLYRDNSDHAVTGTTNETTLGSMTITANTIGATGCIHVVVGGTVTGSAGTKRMQLYLGSTSIIDTGAVSGTVPWVFDIWIFNTATNAQRNMLVTRGEVSGVTTTSHTVSTSSVDTTADQILKVTGILSNGSDTITETMFNVFVCQVT